MKQKEILIVYVYKLMKYFRVLLTEKTDLKLIVCYRFSFLLCVWSLPVNLLRMRYHHVNPEVSLYLAENMGEIQGRNALNWFLVVSEGQEKRNNALADSDLLPLFVNVSLDRVEVQNFGICEFFFLRLGTFRLKSGVHDEE